MRILCKGFNLYNQLHQGKNLQGIVEEFVTIYEEPHIEHFLLGHTMTVIVTDNKGSINCENCNRRENLILPNSSQIAKVTLSTTNLLTLSSTGDLFKTSLNDWQLVKVPNFIVDTNDQIKIITARDKLNVAYSAKGYIYSIPEKLNFCNKNIVDLQAGREHCILLDRQGNVYSFGAGTKGQLGTGQLDDEPNPVLIEALAGIRIVAIAAGDWHSAAVSEQGDLYTWGQNSNGQLGLAASSTYNESIVSVMATPHVVDISDNSSDVNVVKVACGSKHTIILLENGYLYGSGWNKYKQLKNENVKEYYRFTFIQDYSKEKVDKILCGPWNSIVLLK
ncbi:RCC1 domain-containing protein 1 [Euwallacea similis]|uniref:RCC1 domain-containing protein 1 n=1 Tax=Euwallacea similis TaxID=1736056 RepID=UPI00344B5567